MAVPPAPGDDAVGDPSDSTDTPTDRPTDSAPDATPLSARTRRTTVLAAVGVLAVCVLLSAFFVFVRGDSVKVVYDEPDNPQAQRDRVMAVAKSFVTQFSTYGPEDLDDDNRMPGYVERVEKFLTPKFTTSFEQSVKFAEQTVAQQEIARSGLVYALAVTRIEDDSARVLVAGLDSISVPNPKNPDETVPYSDQTFRYEVDLVLTQGDWLVDDFGPVGTLDGPRPDDLPTEAPTTGPPSAPGGGEQE